MGRERQKRKNRSAISKVQQKPKSKKQVFNNAIIAANWDKTQTLSQNYKRLGLAIKLNKQSGGVEKDVTEPADTSSEQRPEKQSRSSLTITPTHNQQTFGSEEVQVERDPTTGRIVRVIPSTTLSRPNPLNDPLNDLDSDDEHAVDNTSSSAGLDNQHARKPVFGGQDRGDDGLRTEVVARLEERARMPSAKHHRRQTDNEQAFIQELVDKHGDDYEAMARDMKVNYMQRSVGDLKRRVKRWREAGSSTS